MTKKDYVLIAGVLQEINLDLTFDLRQYIKIAELFTIALAKENPRFDRTKFLSACGL